LIESKVNVLHLAGGGWGSIHCVRGFPQQQGSYLIGKYFVAFETMFI
jgi:hypothetical protein